MSDFVRLGGCFCGAVRYRLTLALVSRCNCHCQSCRRAAGAPYVSWGTLGLEGFEIIAGRLAIAASSAGVERGLCSACGTSLTYTHSKRPGQIDITLASLDDPADAAPQAHIWLQDKLPWVMVDDGLPCYETFPSAENR